MAQFNPYAEAAMLADRDSFPAVLPKGFAYLEAEPAFDPKRHLQLEKPSRLWTLQEFGYDDATAAMYPSPIAAASVCRMLSDEGVAALQIVIDQLELRAVQPKAEGRRVYNCTYHSRFVRDLANSRDVTDWMSEIFQTPIAPHTMAHLQSQLNFGHDQVGKEIQAWHHDQVSFTQVISMYDPKAVKGGRFEYFVGTREEGGRLSGGNGIAPERLVAPEYPGKGYVAMIQGSAIWHHAQPLEAPGYRASLVHSFCGRDVRYNDANRAYFDDGGYAGMSDRFDATCTEWARHKAWIARAKLGTVLEELPFTEDRAAIAKVLKDAIWDVEVAIKRLEDGPQSREANRALYADDDHVQMSRPRFRVKD